MLAQSWCGHSLCGATIAGSVSSKCVCCPSRYIPIGPTLALIVLPHRPTLTHIGYSASPVWRAIATAAAPLPGGSSLLRLPWSRVCSVMCSALPVLPPVRRVSLALEPTCFAVPPACGFQPGFRPHARLCRPAAFFVTHGSGAGLCPTHSAQSVVIRAQGMWSVRGPCTVPRESSPSCPVEAPAAETGYGARRAGR